jgi:hypothetical protein
VVAVLLVAAAILFAFSLESVVEGLEIFWKISAMMGLAFWAGLFWRRTTAAAAWIGTVVTFAAFLFTGQVRVLDRVLWDFNARYAETLPRLLQKDPELVPEIPEPLVERLQKLPDLPDALRREIRRQPNFTYMLKAALQEPVGRELDKVREAQDAGQAELDRLARIAHQLAELELSRETNLPSARSFDQLRRRLLAEIEQVKVTTEDRIDVFQADARLLEQFDKLDLPELSLPWQMVFYLTVGLAAIVVVSLLTPPVPKEKLDRFYACLRTPVAPEEPETEPFVLPAGVEAAPRRVVFDRFGLEIPRMSQIGLVGVLATAAAVAGLIAGVYWIFSLGA